MLKSCEKEESQMDPGCACGSPMAANEDVSASSQLRAKAAHASTTVVTSDTGRSDSGRRPSVATALAAEGCASIVDCSGRSPVASAASSCSSASSSPASGSPSSGSASTSCSHESFPLASPVPPSQRKSQPAGSNSGGSSTSRKKSDPGLSRSAPASVSACSPVATAAASATTANCSLLAVPSTRPPRRQPQSAPAHYQQDGVNIVNDDDDADHDGDNGNGNDDEGEKIDFNREDDDVNGASTSTTASGAAVAGAKAAKVGNNLVYDNKPFDGSNGAASGNCRHSSGDCGGLRPTAAAATATSTGLHTACRVHADSAWPAATGSPTVHQSKANGAGGRGGARELRSATSGDSADCSHKPACTGAPRTHDTQAKPDGIIVATAAVAAATVDAACSCETLSDSVEAAVAAAAAPASSLDDAPGGRQPVETPPGLPPAQVAAPKQPPSPLKAASRTTTRGVAQRGSALAASASNSSSSNLSGNSGLANQSVTGKGSSPGSVAASDVKKKSKKTRKSAWYNLISPTYKSKCADFRRLFCKAGGVPETEMLIVDYSCALQRDILVHGRLYVSQNYLCFYANIFKWETCVMLKCRDITSMTKEKTALVIPNAIVCQTANERFFFTSFGARDKTYLMLFRIWQNALLAQPMSISECWRWIHDSYGDELGLSTDDDLDYVAPDDFSRDAVINDLEIPIEPGEPVYPHSIMSLPATSRVSLVQVNSDPASILSVNGHGSSSTGVSEDCDKSSSSEDIDCGDVDSGLTGGHESLDCPESHTGMQEYFDKVYAMDIDHLFTCVFTASEFYQDLQARRKLTNLKIGNWERELSPDRTDDTNQKASRSCLPKGQYKQHRTVSYTIPVNHAMAKTCNVVEIQRLHRASKPGKMYSVRLEAMNSGPPYADTFIVHEHLCLRRESENQTRLKFFARVEFHRPPWGIIRGMLEKGALQGISCFVADLTKALEKEVQRLASECGVKIVSSGVLTPHSADSTVSVSEAADVNRSEPFDSTVLRADGNTQTCFSHRSFATVSCIFVCVLLFVNVYLMYLLWSQRSQFEDNIEFPEHKTPTDMEYWQRAYKNLRRIHQHYLEEIIKFSDRTLNEMEHVRKEFVRLQKMATQQTETFKDAGLASCSSNGATTDVDGTTLGS